MQVKLSTLIGQLIKKLGIKETFSHRPMSFFYPSLTVFPLLWVVRIVNWALFFRSRKNFDYLCNRTFFSRRILVENVPDYYSG